MNQILFHGSYILKHMNAATPPRDLREGFCVNAVCNCSLRHHDAQKRPEQQNNKKTQAAFGVSADTDTPNAAAAHT